MKYNYRAIQIANVIETDVIIQPNPVLVVEIGASATLQCFISEDETDYIYWFKQSVGQKPHLVAASHKYSSEAMFYNNFNSTRMKVLADVEINHLIISETKPMDSAMYYCGVLKNYDMIFGEGTFLIVRGKNAFFQNYVSVVQHLVSDPVYPGDSVTLQCTVDSETCAGEHSVYWFRHGSGESLPGLIYTHGNRSDECEKSPEAGSPTHSCVYSLPKRNLSCSDAGIYYCAVVTCGDILFGNGTELDIKGAHVAQKAPNNAKQTEESYDEDQDVTRLHYAVLDFAKKKPKKELGRQITELKQHSVYAEVIATDLE
ncbi:uncharacterized protein LOC108928584 [Scleropages formosus]|uniref:uncharacterized protein LOC108928584 n=1 Tax=Scleropages formosus TaxID=113540 RepID=UPI0010FA65E6|nr:uncharacterized protein LOC108928584 [Scleropages formosus]